MEKLTITEALQEIKTTASRIEKKRSGVAPYLARDHRARDPFETKGGSAKHVKQERQGIGDLEQRLVSIRTAIQRSNLDSQLTVNGSTRSVADWLTWRREVSKGQIKFVDDLLGTVRNLRSEIQKKGGKVTAVASAEVNLSPDSIPEAVINLDEQELMSEQDTLQLTLGQLDGKLSLFNATTVIEF